jgi:hypothetical protein
MNLVVVTLFILWLSYLAFAGWFLVYLFKLSEKKCECALTWHRKVLIALLFIMVMGHILRNVSSMNLLMKNLQGLASTCFIIISLVYIFQLRKIKCGCSNDPARTTMEVLNWMYIGFTAFVLLMLLILSPFISFLKNKT